MAAKRVRVSSDNGVNWFTLPGSSGELTLEGGELDDTIFGFTYNSNFPGLINWSLTANAIIKGFAGYMAVIKKAEGAGTATTAEAATLVAGTLRTYQINNAAKQIWLRTAAVVVKDNAVNQNANVESIDYLFGRATFKSTYTVVGPVTFDITYLTPVVLGKGREYTLTQTAEAVDTTDFATAQANSGNRTFSPGLRNVSLELAGVYALTNAFKASLQDRAEVIVELTPDGVSESVARGFFRFASQAQTGDVGQLEEETVMLNLSVPDIAAPLTAQFPFSWAFSLATTLNTAVRKCIEAYVNELPLDVQYLPDGLTGNSGDAVVTEISLSGGLESMNEFSVTLQGTGALAVV